MRTLLDLFLVFAKIGAFTFGGGYAMISIIEDICVEKKGWITHDEMMTLTVIAESTPGPVAINCSTYVGYRQKGLAGAAVATFGMVLPSFTVIYLVSAFLDNFLEITLIAAAFKGIKIAVGILILDAGIKMLKKSEKKVLSCIIIAVSFALMTAINIFAWNFSSVLLMLTAGGVSLAVFTVRKKAGDGK